MVFRLYTRSLLAELSTEEAFISFVPLELLRDFSVLEDYLALFSGLLFLVNLPRTEVLDIRAFSCLLTLALSKEGSKGLPSALLFNITV